MFMNDQQILDKAIKKANANQKLFTFTLDHHEHPNDAFRLIYDHYFAKALWGNVKVNSDGTISPKVIGKKSRITIMPNWQYHLQMMVVAEDPIKYLGENI